MESRVDKNSHRILRNNIYVMKKWSSIRAVYLMMSLVLLAGLLLQNWSVIIFIIAMLQVATWTKFCPSKWIFEKLGFRNTDI